MDEKIPFEITDQYQAYNNEHILPTFSYNVNSSSNNLSDEEKFVELIILITGFIINVLVLLAIIVRNSMRTSTGCYLLNLVICNFIALLDILGNVVDRWFNLNFKPDVDYINRVTLLIYILTITVFSVDRYIIFCCSKFTWRITLTKISTAIKGIFIIWSFSSIFTAMEFNLYDKFQRQTVINLYIFTTVMYLIMASSIIIILDIMIIIQIMENKIDSCDEKWRMRDSDTIRLLVGITVGFYLTLVPDRVITILYYKFSFFYSTITLSIFNYIAKFSTIFGPILWITTSNLLRKCCLDIIFGRWII